MQSLNGVAWYLISAIRQWAVEFCGVYLYEPVALQENEDSEGIEWQKLCDGVYAFSAWCALAEGRKVILEFTMVDVSGFKRGFNQNWALFGLVLSIVDQAGELERKVPFENDEMRRLGLLTILTPFKVMPDDAFFVGKIIIYTEEGRLRIAEGQSHAGSGFHFTGYREFAKELAEAVAVVEEHKA